ncbi:hypothetical protein ACQP2E_27495 [Actinoplanes sp. CA-015351]|uniref:hypothetical protein n=1 Tax=Actinoplanes sp. CA-015351 TaxID=3239897 RepID=UPI003D97D85B
MSPSGGDDAQWRAWQLSAAGTDRGKKRTRMIIVLAVVALVVALCALRLSSSQPGGGGQLGRERVMPVVFLGGTSPGPAGARLGVTPLRVRKGTPADLGSWQQQGVDVVAIGVPYYVDVRLANKGPVPLDSNVSSTTSAPAGRSAARR